MDADDPTPIIERWVASGGSWRLEPAGPSVATIVLISCDGNEMERFSTERLAGLPDLGQAI